MALLTSRVHCAHYSAGWRIVVLTDTDPVDQVVATYDRRADGWYNGNTKVDDAGQQELDAYVTAIPPMVPPTVVSTVIPVG